MRTLADRYALEDRVLHGDGSPGLAAGGFWGLWRGRDLRLHRAVAVVVVDAAHPAHDEVLAGATAAAQLDHPFLQRVLDVVDCDEGGSALVLEWLPGSSLEDLAALGPLPPADAAALVSRVAAVLAVAEQAGVGHPALAPRWVRGYRSSVQSGGAGSGSGNGAMDGGRWSSPSGRANDPPRLQVWGGGWLGPLLTSQAVGQQPPALDPAADVRRLGLLLHSATTGRWAGPPDESGLPPAPVVGGRPALPGQVRAGVPLAVDRLTARALAAPGTGRRALPNAAAAQAALLALEQQLRSRDARTDDDEQPGDDRPRGPLLDDLYGRRPLVDLHPGDTATPESPRRRGRRLVGIALAAMAATAAVAVGTVVLANRTRPPAPLAGPPPAARTDTADPSQPPPLSGSVPVVAVRDFDPDGNDEENPDLAPLAVDRRLGTAWRTVRYASPQLGGLKPGVGLVVDLGRIQRVGAVTLDLVGRGTSLELRAGSLPAATADGYVTVATTEGAGDVVTLRPDPPVNARYLMIWLTRLPSDGEGYRGGVSEIQVFRS